MEGLFSEILYRMEKQEATVLVTITASSGSTPRGTGSQMLVGRKGRLWGTIGGGAVEGKSIQRAMELLTEQKSELREYPLHVSPTGDIGMVCGGDVTVWLQYIPADRHGMLFALRRWIASMKTGPHGLSSLLPEGSPPW